MPYLVDIRVEVMRRGFPERKSDYHNKDFYR